MDSFRIGHIHVSIVFDGSHRPSQGDRCWQVERFEVCLKGLFEKALTPPCRQAIISGSTLSSKIVDCATNNGKMSIFREDRRMPNQARVERLRPVSSYAGNGCGKASRANRQTRQPLTSNPPFDEISWSTDRFEGVGPRPLRWY
jgi:hypothetical protein